MKHFLLILTVVTILCVCSAACQPAGPVPDMSSSGVSETAPILPTHALAARHNEAIDASRIKLIQFEEPVSGEELAVISTAEGDIRVRLFRNEAPETVAVFTRLATEGYYNGNSFSDSVAGYKIDGAGKPDDRQYPANGEFSLNLWNFRGAVAISNDGTNFMIVTAKQCLNPVSELYDVHFPAPVIEQYSDIGGAPHQDWNNTVFGHVIGGMDVADKISEAAEPVLLNEITLIHA